MDELLHSSCDGGLELLDTTSLKEAEAEDWLSLEIELRKLSLALLRKDKISSVFSKRKLLKLRKSIVWPNGFALLLDDLIEEISHGSGSVFLASKIIGIIWKEYFQALPFPGYWDYEELINRLEKALNLVREISFKSHFQKILNLIDNHQWPNELRHEMEDLVDITYPNDLFQKIANIVKKLKKTKPMPIF